MTDKTLKDEPQEKPQEFNEDKFTWHEGDVQFIEDPEEIEKILKDFLDKYKKQSDVVIPTNVEID